MMDLTHAAVMMNRWNILIAIYTTSKHDLSRMVNHLHIHPHNSTAARKCKKKQTRSWWQASAGTPIHEHTDGQVKHIMPQWLIRWVADAQKYVNNLTTERLWYLSLCKWSINLYTNENVRIWCQHTTRLRTCRQRLVFLCITYKQHRKITNVYVNTTK